MQHTLRSANIRSANVAAVPNRPHNAFTPTIWALDAMRPKGVIGRISANSNP